MWHVLPTLATDVMLSGTEQIQTTMVKTAGVTGLTPPLCFFSYSLYALTINLAQRQQESVA